jgi:signal transduction histidine kinase
VTPEPRRGRTLRGRLALYATAATVLSLVVFTGVAYLTVIGLELREGDAESLTEIEREARSQMLVALCVGGPIAFGLAVAGSLWLTRRALRPLAEVVDTATRMTARDLSQRLPEGRADDELAALVGALNGLFARLEAGFGALGRFAAEASHELRTPLAAIAAELEVALARPRSSAEWEAAARDALDEVRRLTRLVEALLDMARAEGTALPATPVDLHGVVDRVVSGLASGAERAGVALAATFDAGVRVDGNAEVLASAVANLVDNALRYTPRGGRVDVTLLRRGPSVLVHVDDTGPGIDVQESDAIFGPFSRGAAAPIGDHRRAGAGRGVGLGLTIARRIFEHHGGRITVGASPVSGARFTVELPASSSPQS